VLGEVTTLNPVIEVVWDRPVVGAYSANRSEIKIVALNVLKSFSIGVPSWEMSLLQFMLVPAQGCPGTIRPYLASGFGYGQLLPVAVSNFFMTLREWGKRELYGEFLSGNTTTRVKHCPHGVS
jgi:hypothetical protein